MKQILVFILVLSLTACHCDCDQTKQVYCIGVSSDSVTGHSGVTAHELANTVTEILAALKPTMEEKKIDFAGAELSISAKQSETAKIGVSAGGEIPGLEVKLAGEVSRENETSVEVSYQLKKRAEAIIRVIKLDPNNNKDLAELLERLPNTQKLKLRRATVPDSVRDVVTLEKKAADQRFENTRQHYVAINTNVKDSFVKAIEQAITEYELIEKQFDTCFGVEISFSISKAAEANASIEFLSVGVSGSVARSKEGVHSLKLTFGKCE